MENFNLYSSLGFLLVNTSFQAKQNLNKLFQGKGFENTVDQFVVLGGLLNESTTSQTELCQRSCKNSSNLTRILTNMESKGLISRTKGNDARNNNVRITESGLVLYGRLAPIAEDYMQYVFSELTNEEREILEKILIRIREKFDDRQ
jgi:Transcriptional regulators